MARFTIQGHAFHSGDHIHLDAAGKLAEAFTTDSTLFSPATP
jgi:hypothetical protein